MRSGVARLAAATLSSLISSPSLLAGRENVVDRVLSLLSSCLKRRGQPPRCSEQGLLILLLSHLRSHDLGGILVQPLYGMLRSITRQNLVDWQKLFENGFVTTLLSLLLQYEQEEEEEEGEKLGHTSFTSVLVYLMDEVMLPLLDEAMTQLRPPDSSSSSSSSSINVEKLLLDLDILFGVISEIKSLVLDITVKDNILDCTRRIYALVTPTLHDSLTSTSRVFISPLVVENVLQLISSTMRACSNVLVSGKASSSDTEQPGAHTFATATTTSISSTRHAAVLIEIASSILSLDHREREQQEAFLKLQTSAMLAMTTTCCACATKSDKNKLHQTAFEQGVRFLENLPSLCFGLSSFSSHSKKRYQGDIKAAVDVARALCDLLQLMDCDAKATYFGTLVAPLSRSLLHLHSHGNFYASRSRGHEKDDDEEDEDEEFSEDEEEAEDDRQEQPREDLKLLTSVLLEMFCIELESNLFVDSLCRQFIVGALDFCSQSLQLHGAHDFDSGTCLFEGKNRRAFLRMMYMLATFDEKIMRTCPELSALVYFGLSELFSSDKLSTTNVVGHVAKALAMIASKGKFVQRCSDMFCATFNRTLSSSTAKDTPTDISSTSLRSLQGIASGFGCLVEELSQQKDCAEHIFLLRNDLMTMFEQQASLLFACQKVSKHAASNRLQGLGALFSPLASSFSSLGSSLKGFKDKGQRLKLSLRSFWYTLVVFRVKERASWTNNPLWLRCYQIIAVHSPPLLLGIEGSAVGFLDEELSTSPTLQNLAESVGSSHGLMSLWPTAAAFPIEKLSFGQVLYAISCTYVESLRVGGCLDLRPVFHYLDDEDICSLPVLWNAIAVLIDHVFDVWLESACTKLRGTLSDDSRILTSKAQDVVGKVFDFTLKRCTHNDARTRNIALRFAKQMMERISWLLWRPQSLFIVLDLIQALELRSIDLEAGPTSLYKLPTSESTQDGQMHESLPMDKEKLSDAAQNFFVFAYGWLTSAARLMPAEVDAVIQEYLLMERVQACTAHVGVSFAKELASSSPPSFHLTPTTTISLHKERALAASKTARALKVTQTSAHSSPEIFTFELMSKAYYIGEIQGMLNGQRNEMLLDGRKILLSNASSSTSLVALAKLLHENLSERIRSTTSNQHNIVDSDSPLITSMWRCASLVHCIYTLSSTWRNQVGLESVKEWAHRLIRLVSSVALRQYCQVVVANVIIAWRWFIHSHPEELRDLVLIESYSMLRNCSRCQLGMFSHNTAAVSSPNRPHSQDPIPHDLWLSFLERSIESFGDEDGLAFSFFEALLAEMEDTGKSTGGSISASSSKAEPYFRLLCIGLRLLKISVTSARGASLMRRRALRERIVATALSWFCHVDRPLWPKSSSPNMARGGLQMLHNFLRALLVDSKIWSVEYRDMSYSRFETMELRRAGAKGALSFLRQNGADFHSTLPHYENSGEATLVQKHLGICTPLSFASEEQRRKMAKAQGAALVGSSSGVLCLLQMLILHEMDRFSAWLGKEAAGKNDAFHAATPSISTISTLHNYKVAVKSAWCYAPNLALVLARRFRTLAETDGKRKKISYLCSLLITNCKAIHELPAAVPLIVAHSYRALNVFLGRNGNANGVKESPSPHDVPHDCLNNLLYCKEAPAHVALNLLNRLQGTADDVHRRILQSSVVHYAVRSIAGAESDVQIFFLSQLVQLLRRDEFGAIGDLIVELSLQSVLLCHTVMWLLQVEAGPSDRLELDTQETHGYCKQLVGKDPLPVISRQLIGRVRCSLSQEALQYLDEEISFFTKVTNISAILKQEKNKEKHPELIQEQLQSIPFTDGLYLPTAPTRRICRVDFTSGVPMQSAAKCPFLTVFQTKTWTGPDSHLLATKTQGQEDALGYDGEDAAASSPPEKLQVQIHTNKATGGIGKKIGGFKAPKQTQKMLRVQQQHQEQEQGQELMREACIFKVYDDTRQDALTVQVICLLRDEFASIGLPLFLEPYAIVPNRSGHDGALGGIIQVIPSVKSRDQIGKYGGAKTLLEYFVKQHGPSSSASFKKAQLAFASSLAGYAVVCHLLSLKDRHNGNLLIDSSGHVIHIDYGFFLGISPGGNLGFELASFKLSGEMLELLGGESSELYEDFVVLAVRGFLVARHLLEPILSTVSAMADSGLPCFLHKDDNLARMRSRFRPDLADSQASKYFRNLIRSARNTVTTTLYDVVQLVQNGILF